MVVSRGVLVLLIVAPAASFLFAGGPGAGGAYACSCSGPGPPAKELRRSDAVFSGVVTSAEERRTAPVGGPPSLGRVAFAVAESWKGPSGDEVIVYGQGADARCGLDFEEGKTYLVYAFRFNDKKEDSPLGTGLCDATKPLANADADLRALGPSTDGLPETGGPPLILAVLAMALLASLATVAARRRENDGSR